MKKHTLFIAVTCILLLLAGVTCIYAIDRRYYSVSLTTQNMAETVAELHNPYQGWYHIYGYTLSDDTDFYNDTLSDTIAGYKNDIVQLQFNLKKYRSGALSAMALKQLNHILDAWQDSGRQLIVRFLYDTNGHALDNEPEDLSTIILHMDQIAIPVNDHKASIYLMQGIFVGNNGEMHSSNHMSEESMRTLADHLHSVIDTSIFLSVRTPAHWRAISRTYEPLAKKDAFSGTERARIGLFNDGMLGSDSDLGTYGTDDLTTATSFAAKGTLEQELEFQNQLCRYVPNGGEVVLDDARSDFVSAVKSLKRMHISYLNYDHDTTTLDKWRSSTYTGKNQFAGMNGLTYIEQHLGYRYAVRDLTCSFNWKKDTDATLMIKLKNSGFASSYRKFDFTLTLENESTGERTELPLDFDNRLLSGSETKRIKQAIPIRNLPVGTYRLYLRVTDPVLDREITLANSFLHSTTKGYRIGSLRLKKLTKQ